MPPPQMIEGGGGGGGGGDEKHMMKEQEELAVRELLQDLENRKCSLRRQKTAAVKAAV